MTMFGQDCCVRQTSRWKKQSTPAGLVEEIAMNKKSSVKNTKTRGGKIMQSEQKSKQHAMESHHKANVKCSRCGYQHEYKKCPAYGQTCKACKQIKHFAMCRKQVSTKKI